MNIYTLWFTTDTIFTICTTITFTNDCSDDSHCHHCVNFLRKTLGSLKLVGFHIRLCGPGRNLIIHLLLAFLTFENIHWRKVKQMIGPGSNLSIHCTVEKSQTNTSKYLLFPGSRGFPSGLGNWWGWIQRTTLTSGLTSFICSYSYIKFLQSFINHNWYHNRFFGAHDRAWIPLKDVYLYRFAFYKLQL